MTMAVHLSCPGFSKIFEDFLWFPVVFLPWQRNPFAVTGALELAVFADHRGSGDSAEWRSVAAIGERRPGTRDCNSELGDGWDETASRIP
jgi:hypothetical protein